MSGQVWAQGEFNYDGVVCIKRLTELPTDYSLSIDATPAVMVDGV